MSQRKKIRHKQEKSTSKTEYTEQHHDPVTTDEFATPKTPKNTNDTDRQEDEYWVWKWLKRLGIAAGIAYTIITYFMYLANNRAANAARESADTATRQLELTERPWVDANITINGPFSYNVNGALLNVLITIHNSGNSPAFNATIEPRLMMTFGGQDPWKVRNEVCQDTARQVTKFGLGTSLFPNRDFQSPQSVQLGKADIESAQKLWQGHLGNQIVDPHLVVCIAYRPTFNANSVYMTGYVIEVTRIDPVTNLRVNNFPIGKEIDAAHLSLRCELSCIVAN